MKINKLLLLISMILFYLILRYYRVGDTLSIDSVIDNKNSLIMFANKHYLASIAIYVIVYIILVGVGFPVSAALCIVSGLIFGLIEGIIIAVSSATLGSIISFLASRYIFYDYIRRKYSTKVEMFEKRVEKNRIKYILGMRLLPGMPFSITNMLAGLTSIELYTFTWTTVLGMLPGTVVLILTGNALRTVNSISELKSAKLIVPITILSILIFTTIIVREVLKKNKAI